MIKTAAGFLTGRYNYKERGSEPVIPMVEIEVTDPMGKSLMLLKVEDTPEMIESVLRMEGWGIAERNGDRLKLYALDVKEMDAPAPVSLVKEDYSLCEGKRKSLGKSLGAGIILLLLLIAVIVCAIFVLNRNDPTQPELDFGNPLVAEAECHKAVLSELGNNDTAIRNSKVINDTRFPTHYQVVGSAETGRDELGSKGKSFVCDVNYSPDAKTWDAKVSFAGGK